MKKVLCLLLAVGSLAVADGAEPSATRFGVVSTKRCLEESKFGKQEQANFEKMKNQMQATLQQKERTLEELEAKLADDDYMDSISDDAASELKRKKKAIRTEGMQLQNQYMEELQRAHGRVIQKLTEMIAKASKEVAEDKTLGLEAIFSDEACTYFTPSLDVSEKVVEKMDALFEKEGGFKTI